MATPTPSAPAVAGTHSSPIRSDAAIDRARRRALIVIGVVALVSVGLLADLVLVGHTNGKQIWGPITAAGAALVGALSFAFVSVRGRNRVARIGLIVLWLTIAFFGLVGYNSHRQPVQEGNVDSRPRPPLAPLVFTGLGIAGALSLRSGTKGS